MQNSFFFFFCQDIKLIGEGLKSQKERKKQVFQGQLWNFLIMSFLEFQVTFQFHLKVTN